MTPQLAPSLLIQRPAAPLRDQVLDFLRREIVELRLLPGQRLVERELIERTGVGRSTVREALNQLIAEGLVTIIPRKGAIVSNLSAAEAVEVYEVRALLEGAAAKACATKASESQLAELEQAFESLRREILDGADPNTLLAAKSVFYEVLLKGAGNATIESVLTSLNARVSVLRAMTMSAPGRPRQSLDEISAILEAVKRRDAVGAAAAASFHVEQAAQTLFSYFGTQLGGGARG